MSFSDPYKRLVEIKKEIEPLEMEEKFMKEKEIEKYNKRTLKEVENEMFFLAIEMIPIETCIKFFEKKIERIIKKEEKNNEKSIYD